MVYLAREARRWRGFTVAMSAIAALLAVYIAVGQFAPGLLPMGRLPQSAATAPPGSRLVAVLQQEPTAPAFLLTVDPQNRTMTVRRVTASADQGRSYELWLIPNNNPKPRSLGLVGADEFTTRAVAGRLRSRGTARGELCGIARARRRVAERRADRAGSVHRQNGGIRTGRDAAEDLED